MAGPLPYLEAGIGGPEVEFLFIARTVGDVAFAIDAGDPPVGADHGERIVMVRAVRLKEAGWDPDLQFRRELLHRNDRRMLRRRTSIRKEALVLYATEIGPFKQLGRKHYFCAFGGRLANKLAHGPNVQDLIVGERELQRCYGELGHSGTCCEMQWKLPPPARMWSARSPIATRSGNSAWTTSTAA